MFSTLFEIKYKKASFEDVQFSIQFPDQFIIINTLGIHEQECLIKNTIPYAMEERLINDLLNGYDYHRKKIIVYGKNSADESAEKKYKQLNGLGFIDIYIYTGGLFEWILLQDIYGKEEFPTTTKVLDILKPRPSKTFGKHYLEY